MVGRFGRLLLILISYAELALGMEYELLPQSNSNQNPSQISYDLDAALLYSDKLSGFMKPASIQSSESAGSIAADPKDETEPRYRALGLRHMKIGIEWLTPRRLKAFILIRPDAVDGAGRSRRELDTRSGIRTEKSVDIQLLDLYELALLREGVTFAVGVRDRFIREHKAYSDILESGLEPKDPRKSFGMFLDLPAISNFSDSGVLAIRAAALGASEDRHTDRDTSSDTSDDAPAGRTPYWGGGICLESTFSQDTRLGAGFTMVENRTLEGKVTKNLYSLGGTRSLRISGQEIRFGMDVRQAKDTYKSVTINLAPTTSTSGVLTGSAEILPGRMALLGVRVGTMTRQSSNDTSTSLGSRGMQVETGFRGWLGDGMEISTLATREWCRGEFAGEGQSGCYGGTGNRKSSISRFALQLAYRTGGSL
ncbi:MAG: hypothetical protein NTV34_17625 [Proteobacteria bacterium]|nr:hypothetical protein [Pseudomonadota bacterium]